MSAAEVVFDRSMPSPARIARAILEGFNRHYRLFRYVAQQAKPLYENGNWQTMRTRARERIDFYDQRVLEAVARIESEFDLASLDDDERDALWQAVKQQYVTLLADHRQPECAETFFNSVCTKLLHRDYFRNQFIFVRPGVATDYMDSDPPSFRSYYPAAGLRKTLRQIIIDVGLACGWDDVERDLRLMVRAVCDAHRSGEAFRRPWHMEADCQIQILSSLFFRNKGAYVVGRVINGTRITPLAVPILRNSRGRSVPRYSALHDRPAGHAVLANRAYFLVDMEAPSAYVDFLQRCCRTRPRPSCTRWSGLQSRARRSFIAISCITWRTRATTS